jgi:hypothetical protein
MDDDALGGLVLDMVTLGADFDDLRGLVTELAVRVDQLDTPGRVQHHALPGWSTLEPAAAETAWTALTDWMRDVLVIRYPDAERALYPSQHIDVVDAVTALHATWREAYEHPHARAVDAATWLDRWLPSALRQIRDGLRGCSRTDHAEPGPLPDGRLFDASAPGRARLDG